MLKKLSTICLFLLLGCNLETPTKFSLEALNEEVISLNGTKTTFENVLKTYEGKKILIDVWASWCADCIKGLPNVKNIQKKYPEVVYLFLSVDTKPAMWKNGVKKYRINGKHFNLPKGMKNGELVDFINLSWIPRYMVIDEAGNIALFKATKATDKRVIDALNK